MTDPRKIPGSIAGPGGPFDEGGVVIDTRNGILVDAVNVAKIDGHPDNAVAVVIAGRINKSTDRAEVLVLADADGLAAVVSEIIGVAARAGAPLAGDFVAALQDRVAALPKAPE